MTLPQSYEQFLTVLTNDEDGLSTAQITAQMKKLPSNQNKLFTSVQVSKMVFVLRNRGWIATFQLGSKTATYKITPLGREQLADWLG